MTGDERRELVTEQVEDDAVLWDGCDAALIGTSDGRAVYGYARLVQCFVDEGMDEDEAMEWVDYNIVGAYVGPLTPYIVYEIGS